MTARAPAPEALLAHTGWMRRLARSLVRDDAQADDVVQDAMTAALRSPPRDAVALPAWLATTVRNAARQVWRGESRRAARETEHARPEAQPGAAEIVARAEEHGLVVQAVIALEEPYRSAVLFRFFDDLPPREVARRTGVPVETARSHIRRGIEQLRGRLDRAHGGDGRAWRLALVPLTFHHGSSALTGSGAGAATGSKLTTGAMVMTGGGMTAVVGGLALVVGIAVGWWSGARKSESSEAENAKAFAEDKARFVDLSRQFRDQEGQFKQMTADYRGLQGQFRTQQQDFEAIKKTLDETTAALAEARAALAKSAGTAAAPAAKRPRVAFAQFSKLNDVDWAGVGEHLNAISPICAEILAKIAKGEDYTQLQGKAAQHNGFLVNAAVKIIGQVPGTGVNGSFTHPAFQVNAIAAALDAAGKPLTPDEATALEKLGREYSDEDARRLEGYKDTTFGLQKIIDEADLRRRFFDAAFAALTDDQRNTLTPPETKGLLGLDLYSDGLLWITVMRPVQFKDAAALTDSVTTQIQNGMKLPKEQTDALRGIVSRWVADLPAVLVNPQENEAATKGRMHVDLVRLAAAKNLALAESVVTELKLEGTAAANARKWFVTLVPSQDDE